MNKNCPTIFLDEKIFSINDLINLGLISQKDIENLIRRKQAENIIREWFPGMF